LEIVLFHELSHKGPHKKTEAANKESEIIIALPLEYSKTIDLFHVSQSTPR
jgi:hypothetical protein